MEKSELLELYYQLKEEYEEILRKIIEYEMLKEGLKEIQPGETFVNFGGMIFVKANILDTENLLVNIGDNIFVEKPRQEIINLLEKNIQELEKLKQELERELEDIKEKLKEQKS